MSDARDTADFEDFEDEDGDFDDEDGFDGGVSSAGGTPIRSLIEGPVVATTPDATLYEVAALLAASDVGALVVDDGADGEDEATAIVTERDVVRALADLADPAEVRVHSIASTELVWCDISASVAEVAEVMAEHYLRHVLIEDDGKLVGIISSRDLLGVYAASEDLED